LWLFNFIVIRSLCYRGCYCFVWANFSSFFYRVWLC
jgi:hypothetical protein